MSIAQLDYEGAKILIEVESDIENAFRRPCVAKEVWTKDFIESIPADGVFYDVGANIGSYALIAAVRGIQTVAIEPGFNNFAALCRNALRNNVLSTMIPLNVALANADGLAWFDYSDIRQGAASHVLGSPTPRFFSTHRQRVQTFKMDDLIRLFGLPTPTHIKIDVDGNGEVELAVIAGMADTLKNPLLAGLMLEMPLDYEPKIIESLAEHGWQMGERFDMRNGERITGICYGRFERVPVDVGAEVEKPKRAKIKVAA